jgi:hypothetical protein
MTSGPASPLFSLSRVPQGGMMDSKIFADNGTSVRIGMLTHKLRLENPRTRNELNRNP